MADKVAAAYAAFLGAKDIACFTGGEEEHLVQVTWHLKEEAEVTILHIFDRESESVRIVGSGFLTVPEERLQEGYRACNILNNELRFVTFYVDEKDHELVVCYDAKVTAESCGPICMDAMMNMVDILNETYSLIRQDLGLV